MSDNADDDYNYFELKYLEEINELFIGFREKNQYLGINLFCHRDDDFMDLFDMFYENIEILKDEDEINENELNEEENNSML